MKPLLVVFFLSCLTATTASACSTVGIAHLGSADVDQLEVIAGKNNRRRASSDKSEIANAIDFFMTLGGPWKRTQFTLPTPSGSVRFLSEEQTQDIIFFNEAVLIRSGCIRAITEEELTDLLKIIKVSKSEIER